MKHVAIILIVMGILFLFSNKIPIGRLPGDIVIHKGNLNIYFPLMTCIIASIIVSVIFMLIRK